ncbi:hypothetical protein [Anaerotignum sp. MB30-C6]|uniref:hypothetical protein n=1 Tax=Anaerotignum sp. MB30-C6 TaxID=3070814 RepID=UPI0027DDB128|nr:hypothetical protein [Anaerotignum sp. MB30-C6]WMI80929.1 hypothetical protein RBQ60_14080 [Anaerotignum sp. MB30-C6]WMI81915.1 hypothetical protein RBQ60_04075 [Anaerotignum sp. MB30-C6]
MIKLIRDYCIDGQAYDYALKLDTKKDDKDGKRVYSVIGYYGTVDGCIQGLYKVLCRKLVAEEVLTLKEAEKRFQDIANELKVVMPDCFK